jgi:hypothetical protein
LNLSVRCDWNRFSANRWRTCELGGGATTLAAALKFPPSARCKFTLHAPFSAIESRYFVTASDGMSIRRASTFARRDDISKPVASSVRRG